MTMYWIQIYVCICCYFSFSVASLGDLFPTYHDCRDQCQESKCSGQENTKMHLVSLPVYLLWNCVDNCKYECMWPTVDGFTRKGWPPPQFHGKWPFVRIFGVQEPASALFSIMNFAVHFKMFKKFVAEVRIGSPMYVLWVTYGIVCFNAWAWSTIFHTRDTLFTEIMDYLSAFSMVFYSIYIMGMRMILSKKKRYKVLLTLTCLWLFLQHFLYLYVGEFDYQYNLTANILAGCISGLISLLWCYKNWRKAPHARFLAIMYLLIGVTTLLELADFPPYMWVLDAHAIWHLSTIPIPYFMWRFAIEDCKYLRKQNHKG